MLPYSSTLRGVGSGVGLGVGVVRGVGRGVGLNLRLGVGLGVGLISTIGVGLNPAIGVGVGLAIGDGVTIGVALTSASKSGSNTTPFSENIRALDTTDIIRNATPREWPTPKPAAARVTGSGSMGIL